MEIFYLKMDFGSGCAVRSEFGDMIAAFYYATIIGICHHIFANVNKGSTHGFFSKTSDPSTFCSNAGFVIEL